MENGIFVCILNLNFCMEAFRWITKHTCVQCMQQKNSTRYHNDTLTTEYALLVNRVSESLPNTT